MNKERKDIISLAMPTYNGEKYLREQLDSIYAQTRVPDEVIVVDDCSTDGTVEILEEYHKRYGLKYYINEHNLGYNKNFEKAISLCSGDYICLSDQDDVWLREKIEKIYRKITEYDKKEPSLVSSFSMSCNEALVPFKGVINKHRKGGGWRLNFDCYATQGCTIMFNSSLKEHILPIPANTMYDAYIGMTASMIGNRYYIPEFLQLYRIHSGNSFVKVGETKKLKTIIHKLHAYLPFSIYEKTHYDYIRTALENNRPCLIAERLDFINKVLKMYEVGSLHRLFIFSMLPDISFKQKLKTSIGLFLKTILFIDDTY